MSSSLDYLDLCRLCLVKDRVSVPIFEDEGDVRQIFLKITACLPVKVSREDKLPKKLCDDCVYKVELFYQFWNTTANAEKQLLQWLGEVGGLEDKQGYVTEVLDTNVMKQERSSDSRLDGNVMQVGGHQNSMDMGMMDIITLPAGSETQFTSVPMDTSGTVQTVQVVPGPSTQTTHDQLAQGQSSHLVGEESEEDNSDDGCDNEEGLPVKEEHDEDQGDPSLEPTTFVALPCDEAGPSGLQQQKISDITEMSMQQTADNDPKTGTMRLRGRMPRILQRKRPAKCAINPANDAVYDLEQKESPKILKKCRNTLSNTSSQQSVLKYIYVKSISQLQDQQSSITVDVTKTSSKKPEAPTSKSKRIRREVHKCDSCDESFYDRSALIIHKTEKSIVRTREALREPAIKLNCEMCNREFISKGMLTRHYRICGVVNSDNQPVKSQRRYNRNKPTKNKENEATEEGPATCEKCGKVFKKEKYLKVHLTMAHGDHIICQFCAMKFDSVALLKSHMTDKHSGEFTEFCPICNKGFFLRQSLKVHMTAHTRDGNLNYCDICGKGFRHKVYLEKHVQHVHVEMQDQKKYQCGVCAYETQYKAVFREHMYRHTGEDQVQCDICGKRMRKSYLRIHMRIHSGYKPEICEYCGKAFTARKYLMKHRVVHTGEKPYQCRICDKRYTQSGTLTLHMKKKHRPGVENDEEVPEGQEEEEIEEELDQEILDQFVEVSEDGAVVELTREGDDHIESDEPIDDEADVEEYELGEIVENAIDNSGEVFEEGEEIEVISTEKQIIYASKIYDMNNIQKKSSDIAIYRLDNEVEISETKEILDDVNVIAEDSGEIMKNKDFKCKESQIEKNVISDLSENEDHNDEIVEEDEDVQEDFNLKFESSDSEVLNDGIENTLKKSRKNIEETSTNVSKD